MSEPPIEFRLLSTFREIEVIARGRGIGSVIALRRKHGGHNWRKMKGIARIEDEYGNICDAEIHWYEAHGVGRIDWKIKRKFL